MIQTVSTNQYHAIILSKAKNFAKTCKDKFNKIRKFRIEPILQKWSRSGNESSPRKDDSPKKDGSPKKDVSPTKDASPIKDGFLQKEISPEREISPRKPYFIANNIRDIACFEKEITILNIVHNVINFGGNEAKNFVKDLATTNFSSILKQILKVNKGKFTDQ